MSSFDSEARAIELRATAEAEPATVDEAELVDLLVFGTDDARRIAFDAYESLVSAQQPVDAIVARLRTHLTADSTDTRRRAALTTATLVEQHADAFDALVPALHSISQSTGPGHEPAVIALARIAANRPAAVTPAVDTLVDCCLDTIPACEPSSDDRYDGPEVDENAALEPDRARRDAVRLHAIAALTLVANDNPAAIEPSSERIAVLLEDDHHLVRSGACELFEALAWNHPDVVLPFVSALAERATRDSKHPVPWRAAAALAALTAERSEQVGEALAPHVEELSRFLQSANLERRRTGSILVAATAQARPSSVEPLLPSVRELVAADDADVRRNAVIALGAAGDTEDSEVLATLAETDDDSRVRDTASRVLE